MPIINLTPHIVRVFSNTLEIKEYLSQGCARIEQSTETVEVLDSCYIARPMYGEAIGLPPYENGTYYIVSNIVANAMKHRDDLFYPDSGPDAIRKDGQVYAVKRLLSITSMKFNSEMRDCEKPHKTSFYEYQHLLQKRVDAAIKEYEEEGDADHAFKYLYGKLDESLL